MNKKNREDLAGMIDMISNALNELKDVKVNLESVREGEEDKYENMPEGLQNSERGEAISNAIDHLTSAEESLQDGIEALDQAKDSITEAIEE